MKYKKLIAKLEKEFVVSYLALVAMEDMGLAERPFYMSKLCDITMLAVTIFNIVKWHSDEELEVPEAIDLFLTSVDGKFEYGFEAGEYALPRANHLLEVHAESH